MTWCGQVFNEPGTVLCTLISQTLVHLDPSLSSCITEFIKNEPNIIGKLIELRQVRVHHYCIFLLILIVTAGTWGCNHTLPLNLSYALACAFPHDRAIHSISPSTIPHELVFGLTLFLLPVGVHTKATFVISLYEHSQYMTEPS